MGIATDNWMYNYAVKINSLDQMQDEVEKMRVESFKPIFCKMVLNIVKNPSNNPLDDYLYFTARRTDYPEQEALRIEMELIEELREFVLSKKENSLKNIFKHKLN